MSKEVADDEIPMFSCCEDKDIERVFKTMNLEGHCPAVEIRTGVQKVETLWPRKGLAATRAKLRLSERGR